MSMIFAGALMGLGQGLRAEADRLSDAAKEEASAERSLELYRAKKEIDLEFKMGGKGKSSPGSSSGSGRSRSASTVTVANSAAPTAGGAPGTGPGASVARWEEINGRPLPRQGDNIPAQAKGKPKSLTISGENSEMAQLNQAFRALGVTDEKEKLRIRADAERVKGAGGSMSTFFLNLHETRGKIKSEDPEPVATTAAPAQPAVPSGFDDPSLSAGQPARTPAPAPAPSPGIQAGRGTTPTVGSRREIGMPEASPAASYRTPNAAQIAALRANPSKSGEFDALFGPGAAAKYLR